MDKIKVVEGIANVRISSTRSMTMDPKGFVRFAIQSQGYVEVGRKLFVFDHRASSTLEAAKAIKPDAEWDEAQKALSVLAEAVNQPAKVVVMKKVDDEKEFFYVNLYPANGLRPTALFFETLYVEKHNAGFNVKEDNSLWTWKSESSSRTGAHREMVLVALTDDDHQIIVDSYGHANIGHTDENLTVIGAEIRKMSEEDLVVDFEP